MTDGLEFADQAVPPAERRQHSRQQVRSIAYVELDEGNGGIVLNISEGGLSVQAVVSLMDNQLPHMRVQLPQPNDWVEAGARIAWTGKSRKVVGLEFVDLPEQARSQIREWISQETLPAPPPHESQAEPREGQGLGVTAAAGETAVLAVEPVAAGPSREDPARKASLMTEGDAILPATQPWDAPPARNSTVVSAPEPAPERTIPIAPAPISRATPRPAGPAGDEVRSRTLGQPRYTELRLTEWTPSSVSGAPTQAFSHRTLATLITLLALMSLATGWAAGRGAFDGIFAKVQAMTSHKSAAVPDVKTPPTAPVTPASEIRATNADKLALAIPAGASTPAPAQISRSSRTVANQAPQRHQKLMTLQAANTVPTVQRPGYANSFDEAPLTVTDLGGRANISSLARSMDYRGSIPPPQVEPQRAILKPAELIRRVDPIYPTTAREQRIDGTVKLRVTIGQDGTVRSIEVLSGPRLLTGAAISAVRQWRYSPTMLNGKSIQADNEVNLVFRLSASSR